MQQMSLSQKLTKIEMEAKMNGLKKWMESNMNGMEAKI